MGPRADLAGSHGFGRKSSLELCHTTFSSVLDSVCDADHDPCPYIVSEEFLCPDVPYPSNRDCSIMVTDLVPPAILWDVDEIVDIQIVTEVWAVNRYLTEG
ncbi:hypothetical protein RHMOL_Rhmol11G0002400 [Rhododendron molle]|uniref:Uncharacterized protein n=1 Tax=Rhododendron molle TaxID=49168 RepID=A0ACC0LMJ1_RHOML|nr:hypothetical protein RHMOL_Rhmol11G0002400 [Rhododendron molle]